MRGSSKYIRAFTPDNDTFAYRCIHSNAPIPIFQVSALCKGFEEGFYEGLYFRCFNFDDLKNNLKVSEVFFQYFCFLFYTNFTLFQTFKDISDGFVIY